MTRKIINKNYERETHRSPIKKKKTEKSNNLHRNTLFRLINVECRDDNIVPFFFFDLFKD